MKLKFITPTKEEPVYRATVHKTGKIGLTIQTANQFGIRIDKSIALAINEEDPNDTSIYGILYEKGVPDTYRILKGGDYHSINAKSFFDTARIDYYNNNLSYNVTEITIDGSKVLKFSQKVIEKNTETATLLQKTEVKEEINE